MVERVILPPKSRKRITVTLVALLISTLAAAVLLADVAPENIDQSNPIAEYWRQVREGVTGYSAVIGQESGVLIQGSGENWRRLRNGPAATVTAWTMAITVLALGLFYILRGQVKLTEGRSGELVLRWNGYERFIHWYSAILFLILSLTGLSILYGRALLIPLFGHEIFAAYAEIVKLIHNFSGPLFLVGLLLVIARWFKDNLPNRVDIAWFGAFGGMIGDRHPSAGRMNAGEKMWFWLLFWGGSAICASGLLLDFPNLGFDRLTMQIGHLVHLIFAALLIAGALGHIYIGTIGSEGAFEGMIGGKVDTAWAQQHHDLWLDSLREPRGQERTAVDDALDTDRNHEHE